jgi:acrylyl-CoA reductase (NADPH)
MAPQSVRAQAWQRLARDLDISKLASITHEIALDETIAVAASLSTSIDNY